MSSKWSDLRRSSSPEDGHSIKEVEHRFTDLEAFSRESTSDRRQLHEIVEHHGEKLQTHEKAILGLIIAFSALLQEQFPRLAALLKGTIP